MLALNCEYSSKADTYIVQFSLIFKTQKVCPQNLLEVNSILLHLDSNKKVAEYRFPYYVVTKQPEVIWNFRRMSAWIRLYNRITYWSCNQKLEVEFAKN